MIEDYLEKAHAKSSANIFEDLPSALKDETVETVLLTKGHLKTEILAEYAIIFKSGTSFVFSSNGAYWINGKASTKELLVKELIKTEPYHEQHQRISDLIRKLQG